MTTPPQDPSEYVFAMDPQQTILELARQLVGGQNTLVNLAEAIDKISRTGVESAQVRQIVQNLTSAQEDWFSATLPNIVAAFQVAIEAYDTFGSGPVTVEDPIDAALWNNKIVAYRHRLSNSNSGSSAGGGGTGGDDIA